MPSATRLPLSTDPLQRSSAQAEAVAGSAGSPTPPSAFARCMDLSAPSPLAATVGPPSLPREAEPGAAQGAVPPAPAAPPTPAHTPVQAVTDFAALQVTPLAGHTTSGFASRPSPAPINAGDEGEATALGELSSTATALTDGGLTGMMMLAPLGGWPPAQTLSVSPAAGAAELAAAQRAAPNAAPALQPLPLARHADAAPGAVITSSAPPASRASAAASAPSAPPASGMAAAFRFSQAMAALQPPAASAGVAEAAAPGATTAAPSAGTAASTTPTAAAPAPAVALQRSLDLRVGVASTAAGAPDMEMATTTPQAHTARVSFSSAATTASPAQASSSAPTTGVAAPQPGEPAAATSVLPALPPSPAMPSVATASAPGLPGDQSALAKTTPTERFAAPPAATVVAASAPVGVDVEVPPTVLASSAGVAAAEAVLPGEQGTSAVTEAGPSTVAPMATLGAASIAAPPPSLPPSQAATPELPLWPPLDIEQLPVELGDRLQSMNRHALLEASLDIEPPDMGPLRVQLRLQEGGLAVLISGDQPQTLQLIQSAVPALREQLQQGGLQLLELQTQTSLTHGGERDARDPQRQRPDQSAVGDSGPTVAAGRPASQPNAVPPEARSGPRLDAWV